MSLPRRAAGVVCVATMLIGLASHLDAAGRAVTFHADDGRSVSGTLIEASRLPAPAILLIPALGHPQDEWQGVAQRLADAGMTALTIDTVGSVVPAAKEMAGWNTLVRGAVSYLASLSTVRTAAIGIAGASWGGSLAASEAAGDPRVRALAIVSPSSDYRGIRIEGPLRQYGARPALFVASRRDSYAVRSARELTRDAPGPRETLLGDAPAHGVPLLSAEPDLRRMFVEWFQRTLAVN